MNKNDKLRHRKRWRNLPLHLMLLPGVVLLFIYAYVPMFGLVMAFQNYKPTRGILGSKWVGLNNFQLLFGLPNTSQVIRNTVFIAAFKIVLNIVVPVLFALLLNEIRHKYFKRVSQTLVYLPHFLSWVIVSGIFINILSPSNGMVNMFLNKLGLESLYFLGDAQLFPWTVIVTDVWKEFGYGSIVYLAALTSIDPTLYEAAAIDGAGRLRQVFHVALPGILPIVAVMGTLAVGNILNAGFDQVFNMYSPQVYTTGDILDTLVYRLGMEQQQYSLSTAVGLFKSVISLVLVSGAYGAAYKFAGYRIF